MRSFAPLLALTLALAACGAPEGITECEAVADLEPICRFQNPEDLARVPGTKTLLVSQFGHLEKKEPGSLAAFDTASDDVTLLYRGGDAEASSPAPGWGETDCAEPPEAAFSPHGIHLSRRRDGALQLLVVNHGGREAIEFFEVAADARSVTWRGCALPPDEAFINSVVATPEGGFLATHMFARTSRTGALAGMFGRDTGHVFEWTPDGSWSVLPGSEAPFPNGIELSPDGRFVYLNAYLADEVRKLDRETGEVVAVAPVPAADNTRWSEDGSRLLVASHTGPFAEMMSCQRLAVGACPLAFEIVALDPETLERETLLVHEGPPMGAATVALDLDGTYYLGSFKGDRLLRWRAP